MKKKLDIEGLDCAVCAGKLEDALKKIDGMQDVSVNFLLEKVTFEYDEEREQEMIKEINKVAKKILPDVEIKFE